MFPFSMASGFNIVKVLFVVILYIFFGSKIDILFFVTNPAHVIHHRMKKYYLCAFLGLFSFLLLQCSNEPKNEDAAPVLIRRKKEVASVSQNAKPPLRQEKSKEVPATNPKSKPVNKVIKNREDKINSSEVEVAIPDLDVPYVNPNQAKWDETFGNDSKWMSVYNESVYHFLVGCQNNLDSKPSLTMEKEVMVHAYAEKMYNTFFLTPEFGEFCKMKFENSPELQNFIRKNSGRVTGW